MSSESLSWLTARPGRLGRLRALRRSVLLDLLPADLARRTHAIDSFDGPALPGLGGTHDLWGDGSLRLVRLPGHARGQLGLLVRTPTRDVLLAADGAWLSEAIRTQRPPHPITYPIVDDRRALLATLRGLSEFAHARPDVAIMPTHCPEVYAREVGG